ncbi:PREDICTED: ATP synthase subunit s-like protein [Ceratosolen solmsi marchali]|uniref:ATP synthase subunit s-like protein n=1 Tax=Ceratosolen solmsi marchali TaxID=326594 RepID=A0AAJ7DUS3_9HYME|nr:PREDICTED: ATP synthase subunit s-like protein [Ceratosolen solmsi marchali]
MMTIQINIKTKLLKIKYLQFSNIFAQSISCGVIKHYPKSKGQAEIERVKKKLESWRGPVASVQKPIINISPDLAIFKFFQADIEVNPLGIIKFLKRKTISTHQNLQNVNHEIEKYVGYDLALAYFLVSNGGKVKFKGQDEWIQLNKDNKTVDLPQKYDPNYIVTEIDASDFILYYNGLENFKNSSKIKKAIFKRSPLFDDWYMDRISSYFPCLEYLDISDCPNVTERALEALYRCSDLQTLIITDYKNTVSFQLTCLMLNDCIPDLKIEILKPTEVKKLNINSNYF